MNRICFVLLCFFATVAGYAQEQFSVYFETNKHELSSTEQARLREWMASNKTSKILAINGYTDEDGSVGLNDTLAQRRVSFVYDIVKDNMKIRQDFKTRSFGKLHKQDAVKAKNRKATIYYLLEKDLDKENQILGIQIQPSKPVEVVKPIEFPATIKVANMRGGYDDMKLDVAFMNRINTAKTGETIVIPNLNFQENTFAVMPDSRPRLFELLEVMRSNPGLKIKLQGHVCCMTKDRNDLSTQRAKAVMMFLFQNGIEKSRLSFEGFGVSKPIYAIPEKTPAEREANRRVEVFIIANN